MPAPLLDLVNRVMTLLISQTFWTAIGAIGTVSALYFIYRQIATARDIAAYEFLRKEDDRFRSEDMARHRSDLAKVLLLRSNDYKQIDEYADYVLDYFEDLGLMLRNNLASEYLIWTSNCYYVLRYWELLKEYIDWVRKEKNDLTYHSDFEYLHKKMLKFEKRATKKKKIAFTQDELREFLEEELYVELRPVVPSDMDRIMEIEESSFDAGAYPRSQFEELSQKHPEGFLVAEIFGQLLGYAIGYVSNDTGEIDSLAVDPRFRHLGIGRRLCEFILERFRERGIKACSLEVRTTNEFAIRFFKKMEFQIAETLTHYYDDGGNAYLMRMNLDVD